MAIHGNCDVGRSADAGSPSGLIYADIYQPRRCWTVPVAGISECGRREVAVAPDGAHGTSRGSSLCGRRRRRHRAETPNPWWRARCVGVAPWASGRVSARALCRTLVSSADCARAVIGAGFGRATSDSQFPPPGRHHNAMLARHPPGNLPPSAPQTALHLVLSDPLPV